MAVIITAILLAAGLSIRMKEQKLLMKLGNKKLYQWSVDNISESMIDQTIVVTTKKIISNEQNNKKSIDVVYNEKPEEGMASSLKLGLKALKKETESVAIFLADQPLVNSQIINSIIDKYMNSSKSIGLPYYQGVPGHPVLFDTVWVKELLKIKGDIGARELISRYPKEVLKIKAPKEVILDTNQLNDYDFLLEYMKNKS